MADASNLEPNATQPSSASPGGQAVDAYLSPRRRSIRLHLASVQISLLGMVVLTMVVLWAFYTWFVTSRHKLRDEFESLRYLIGIAWTCGYAIVAAGRAVCLFDARGTNRRGLPMGSLFIDMLGVFIFYKLAGVRSGSPMLPLAVYFSSSAVYAAYLGRLADLFQFTGVRKSAAKAMWANLAMLGTWIFLVAFAPGPRDPVDSGYRMAVALASMVSAVAHVLQMMLVIQFGNKAAKRLRNYGA